MMQSPAAKRARTTVALAEVSVCFVFLCGNEREFCGRVEPRIPELGALAVLILCGQVEWDRYARRLALWVFGMRSILLSKTGSQRPILFVIGIVVAFTYYACTRGLIACARIFGTKNEAKKIGI